MDANNAARPRPQPRVRERAIEVDYAVEGDGADPGRRVWPVALAAAIVGLVLGGLVGLGYTASQAADYQATTSISVLPDPNLDFSNDTNDNSVQQDATAFIQSQLIVINGAQLTERVRDELKLSSTPSVEATQVGQTYVVSITASAGTREDAVRVAQQTATDYDSVRTGQLTSQVNALLSTTGDQISSVSKSLSASRGNSRSSTQVTLSQTALQTEYERLLSQRSSLNGVKAQAARIVSVVAPARASSAGLSAAAKNALVGALVGALLLLAAFVVVRRSVRRIRTVADLTALGVPALLPVQSRRPWRAGRMPRSGGVAPDAGARLLAARLDPELTTGDPLVFVGATAKAGADRVSLGVASALTDRGPVLYVPRTAGMRWFSGVAETKPSGTAEAFGADWLTPSDVPGVWLPAASTSAADEQRPTRVSRTAHFAAIFRHARHHGFVVVVEADPVSVSDTAVDCGRAGASIVLVASRDLSTPSDVVVATELFAAQSVTFAGAVLNEAPWLPIRAWSLLRGHHGVLVPGMPDMSAPASRHRDAAVTRGRRRSGAVTAEDTGRDPSTGRDDRRESEVPPILSTEPDLDAYGATVYSGVVHREPHDTSSEAELLAADGDGPDAYGSYDAARHVDTGYDVDDRDGESLFDSPQRYP